MYQIICLKYVVNLCCFSFHDDCIDNDTNHHDLKTVFCLLTVVMDDEDGRCLLDVIW